MSFSRIDPQEKLMEIQKEISALHKLYSSQPVFGVEYITQEEPPKEEEIVPVDTMEEYNEIDETNPETQDAFAAYLAEGSQKDREVISWKTYLTCTLGGFLSGARRSYREDQGWLYSRESLVCPSS